MSTRKSKEREAKKLARFQQGKVLAGAKPAPTYTPTATAVSTKLPLSPKDEMLWNEIRLVTSQVQRMLQQAAAKIVARALVEAAKEVRQNN